MRLRGFQDTKIPMVIAAAGYWIIAIPVACYLGLYTDLGGIGVWIGLASGLAICAIALVERFYRLTNRDRHLVPNLQR